MKDPLPPLKAAPVALNLNLSYTELSVIQAPTEIVYSQTLSEVLKDLAICYVTS